MRPRYRCAGAGAAAGAAAAAAAAEAAHLFAGCGDLAVLAGVEGVRLLREPPGLDLVALLGFLHLPARRADEIGVAKPAAYMKSCYIV